MWLEPMRKPFDRRMAVKSCGLSLYLTLSAAVLTKSVDIAVRQRAPSCGAGEVDLGRIR
jgi:hypothetical protein